MLVLVLELRPWMMVILLVFYTLAQRGNANVVIYFIRIDKISINCIKWSLCIHRVIALRDNTILCLCFSVRFDFNYPRIPAESFAYRDGK